MPGPGLPLIAGGVGIALRGFGKALSTMARRQRRQRLGLPRKTYTERMRENKARAKKKLENRKKARTGGR
jgi:Sec-independent protein translocase protein TatA